MRNLRWIALAWLALATTAAAAPWSVIWLPANDTFRSWDWREISGGNDNTFKICPADYSVKFPTDVATWELAVCSRTAPEKKIRIALPNPLHGNVLDLSGWTPDELRGADHDRLAAMGEGTFLCAILGDGQRYSNVNRVTIRHDYDPRRESVIRLVAIQPATGRNQIDYIGAWIVAPASDEHLLTTVLGRPQIEIDGAWASRRQGRGGAIWPLQPGVSYAWLYPLRNAGFDPDIPPFTAAKVRIQFTETGPSAKTYLSEVFPLVIDRSDAERFDRAFDVRP